MEKRVGLGWVGVAICVLLLGCWGCGEDPRQVFETAQFEEKQGNREHAQHLYEQIVQMHPESDLAKRAGERLADLRK